MTYRGFKKVGPFVVMIYRMILGDLLRFVTIYIVFIMGFSQGGYQVPVPPINFIPNVLMQFEFLETAFLVQTGSNWFAFFLLFLEQMKWNMISEKNGTSDYFINELEQLFTLLLTSPIN